MSLDTPQMDEDAPEDVDPYQDMNDRVTSVLEEIRAIHDDHPAFRFALMFAIADKEHPMAGEHAAFGQNMLAHEVVGLVTLLKHAVENRASQKSEDVNPLQALLEAMVSSHEHDDNGECITPDEDDEGAPKDEGHDFPNGAYL